MKAFDTFLMSCVLVYTISCSTVTVNYDYDTKTDFADLQTYDWLPVPVEAEINSLTVSRVTDAVNTALKAKGLEMTADNPDFLIGMHLGKDKKLSVDNRGYTYAPPSRYWGAYRGPGPINVYQYEEGTLILDFVAPESKHLVWRGVAKSPLEHAKTPEKREKLINEAVQKIFKKFPPPSPK